MFPFRDAGPDGKWGYIDAKGKVVIKPAYRQADDFVSGLARVTTSDETVYINSHGLWVFNLPDGCDATRRFSEGLAGFSVGLYAGKPDKWGYFDRNGKVVIRPKYDRIGDFSGGLARVNSGAKWEFPGRLQGGKWGFIDKSGRVVIPVEFDNVGDFSAGQARVEKQGKWFYIDRQGRRVGTPKTGTTRKDKDDLPTKSVSTAHGQLRQTNDREPFHGALARVHIGGTFCVANDGPTYWHGGAWYYVNRQGKLVRRVRNDRDGKGSGYGREYR